VLWKENEIYTDKYDDRYCLTHEARYLPLHKCV
jgi:hypothetical protein